MWCHRQLLPAMGAGGCGARDMLYVGALLEPLHCRHEGTTESPRERAQGLSSRPRPHAQLDKVLGPQAPVQIQGQPCSRQSFGGDVITIKITAY